MSMAVNARVHDPLFHFETHFPERLSRLHLNPEFSGGGGGSHPVHRKKKSRAARQGVRYKTQPITFDEIQEVDEEGIKEDDKDKTDGLKTQFTAFSKSMDGLVPKPKNKKADDAIQECVDESGNGIRQTKPRIRDIGRVHSDSPELRLQSEVDSSYKESKENKENEPDNGSKPDAGSVPLGLPPSGPNSRRQRTTAKAKKRQMQAEVQGGGDKGT